MVRLSENSRVFFQSGLGSRIQRRLPPALAARSMGPRAWRKRPRPANGSGLSANSPEAESLVVDHVWLAEQTARSKRFDMARRLHGDDQLLSAAMEGLCRAANMARPERYGPGGFVSFARLAIGKSIHRFISRVKPPENHAPLPRNDVLEARGGGNHEANAEAVAAILGQLDAEEKAIVAGRFGLNGRPASWNALGEQLGISAGEVRRRLDAILERLRESAV